MVGTLSKALAATPLERVQMNMEQFEKIFESLDVQTNAVTGAMQSQINLSTPQDQVGFGAEEAACGERCLAHWCPSHLGESTTTPCVMPAVLSCSSDLPALASAQVDEIIQQVATAHNLEVDLNMPNAKAVPAVKQAEKPQDDLQARLAALR